MLWYVVDGNKHKVALSTGVTNITETFTTLPASGTRFKVWLPYYVQRLGFSSNVYEVDGIEFWRMMYIEKSRGTYLS